MVAIKQIHIRNFRSIKDMKIDVDELTLLVGQNDAGKSNILRALNLFFNGETSPGQALSFQSDNYFLDRPNKKARRITVELEIELPEAYRGNNGDRVVWTKSWRDYGEEDQDISYRGVRITKGRKGQEKRQTVEIGSRSNVHALLRNIQFVYVPAIRDERYFEHLRGRIYHLIADVAEKKFRESSGEFEDAISEHLADLTDALNDRLAMGTKLALPRDMTHVFEKLDFQSGVHNVSLESRGDGIKARHIPVILRYMAQMKKGTQSRGAAPFTFIWGYEEPENNVEMTRCFQMADEFRSYVDEGIAQILLTTHSPVFYNLSTNSVIDHCCLYHIYMRDVETGTVATDDLGEVDDSMGISRLVAPYLVTERTALEARNRELELLRDRQLDGKKRFFVEGPSDQRIMQAALEAFVPDAQNSIIVDTRQRAGDSFVGDMLSVWLNYNKHLQREDRRNAVGLLDCDDAGKDRLKVLKATLPLGKRSKNGGSIQCFLLPAPDRLRVLPDLPIVLEKMYPGAVWEHALAQGWLEPSDFLKYLTPEQGRLIAQPEHSLESVLGSHYCLSVEYDCLSDHKMSMAEYALEHHREETLRAFCDLITRIDRFLM